MRIRLTFIFLAFVAPAIQAADCNANGVEDAVEIAADPFGFTRSYWVELGPDARMAELGDMDGDARPDIVGLEPGRVSVHRAVKAGEFLAPLETEVAPASEPYSPHLALADLDRDGDLDAAVAGSFELQLFRNSGGGKLESAAAIPIGTEPDFVTAADLNGDGLIDLVTANMLDPPDGAANLSVLLNGGGAAFAGLRNYAAKNMAGPPVAADIDGDGDVDLVLSHWSDVLSLLKSSGDGMTFVISEITAAAQHTMSGELFTSDWDQDGDLDILVGLYGRSTVSFLLNDGPGGFRTPLTPDLTKEYDHLCVADLDGDGREELIASPDRWSEGEIAVFRSAGADLVAPWTDFPARLGPGKEVRSLLSADMDRDGDGDLVAIRVWEYEGYAAASATVFLNRGTGDCNHDGVLDACEPDCNGSGWPDDCDVELGGEADCDGDLIPDACELIDANENGMADFCELREGVVSDCDRNGVPDDADSRPRFTLHAPYELPDMPYSRATGHADLDGDGDLDVAGAHSHGISVLENDGSGGFLLHEYEDDRIRVGSPSAGDLDLDGDADLIVSSKEATLVELHVLLNDGKARFTFLEKHVLQAAGEWWQSPLTAADLDGDGVTDVALVRGGLWLLTGRGNGTLHSPILAFPRASPLGFRQILAFDADGDGDLDLAGDQGSLLLNSHGLFLEESAFPAGPGGGIAAADLDGDQDPDLITDRIALNDSAGSFIAGQTLMEKSSAVTASDLDGDGDIDVILSSPFTVFLNAGGASFPQSVAYPTLPGASSLASGDFDADGDPDVLADKRLYWNDGRGGFPSPTFFSPGPTATWWDWWSKFFLADIDADGDRDMAWLSYSDPVSIELGMNDGRGHFNRELRPVFGSDELELLAAEDVDGDGAVDLVLRQDWSFLVLFNDHHGQFLGRSEVGLGKEWSYWQPGRTAADLDGDGDTDLLAYLPGGVSGDIVPVLNAGGRRFELGRPSRANHRTLIAEDDFDGDGDLDLLATAARELVLYENDGAAGFVRGAVSAVPVLESWSYGTALASDLNGDGLADLALSNCNNDRCRDDYCWCRPNLTLFLNSGGGVLEAVESHELEYNPVNIAGSDLDLDGDIDLVMPWSDHFNNDGDRLYDYRVQVYLNNGQGRFRAWGFAYAGRHPGPVAVDDLDGDGMPDIAVSLPGKGHIAVFFNRTVAGAPDTDGDGILDRCEPPFQRGDWNQDGRLDLSDAVGLLGRLFGGLPAPSCEKAGDADDDGALTLTDPLRILLHLFQGGAALPPPFGSCGPEGTHDALPCREHRACSPAAGE